MKNIFVALIWLVLACLAFAKKLPKPEKSDFIFLPNQGQIKDIKGNFRSDLLFTTEISGIKVFFSKNRISYVFPKIEEENITNLRKFDKPIKKITELYRLDLEILGANPNVTVEAEDPAPEYINMYLGHTGTRLQKMKIYGKLVYKNIYPNIDLVFYGNSTTPGGMKYDFIVHPGADPSIIKLKYYGAQNQELQTNGNLVITNPLGRIIENSPFCYQENVNIDAKKIIPANFIIKDGIISFGIGAYDKNQKLVIDPLVIYWSTYYGGSTEEDFYDITLDNDGNVIVTGAASSIDFPVTIGPAYTGGQFDVVITKFNSSGARLWSTYYGGSFLDVGNGVATAPNGDIAITGRTNSTNLVSGGGYNGGTADAFVAYFNSNGVLQWDRYFGGSTGGLIGGDEAADEGWGVGVDQSGNVYITGVTNSTDIDFPVSSIPGAFVDPNGGGQFFDVFVARYNNSGVLEWTTYYGSPSNDEVGFDIAVSAAGVAVTGNVFSTNFPVTPNAAQSTFGGIQDAFVIRFNSSLQLVYATYFGGEQQDDAISIDMDAAGRVVITGTTRSTTFQRPTPTGSFTQQSLGGLADAYLAEFNPSGGLVWATYYGGNSDDNGRGVDISRSGEITLVGRTRSSNFPIINSYQGALNGTAFDAFVIRFNAERARDWATYLGGNQRDEAYDVVTDATGLAYVCGFTQSSNFPTQNPFQASLRGNKDAFVLKIGCEAPAASVTPSTRLTCSTTTTPITLVGTPVGGTFTANCTNCINGNQFLPNIAGPGTFRITYSGFDRGCPYTVRDSIVVGAPPNNVAFINLPQFICVDASPLQLNANPAGGTFSASCGACVSGNRFNPTAAGAGQHTITYSGTINGCNYTTSATITVSTPPNATIGANLLSQYCRTSGSVTLTGTPSGGTFTLNGTPLPNNTFTPSSLTAGIYTIGYQGSFNGCNYFTSRDVAVNDPPTPRVTGIPSQVCITNPPVTATVFPTGGTLSGPGVEPATTNFIPRNAGVGTHTLTYSGELGGCRYSTSFNVSVINAPAVSIAGFPGQQVCQTASAFTLTGRPAGGTFSVTPSTPALSGSVFTPANAVPGTYEITYQGTEGACNYSTSISITITAPIPPAINGLAGAYCANAGPVNLTGVPAGGTFSGPGVTGTVFLPSSLQPGTYTITYSGNQGGCNFSTAQEVIITAQPIPSITGISSPICITALPVSLRGTPAGGTFSGTGNSVTGNTFNPSSAGTYTITYSGNLGGCAYSTNISVTVTATPTVSISNLNSPYCTTSPPVNLIGLPSGGTFSGIPTGLTPTGTLTPSAITPGTYTITYSGNIGGCSYSTTALVTISSPPTPAINGLADAYCSTDAVVNLTLSPAGGTLSGTGVVQPSSFNPNLPAGSYTITYSGNLSGCAYTTSRNVRITTPPTPSILGLQSSYCVTSTTPVTLIGNPSGGTFSLIGGSSGLQGNVFTPSAAGAGTYRIRYSGNLGGCQYSTEQEVTVTAQPTASISGLGGPYCITASSVTLTGNPAGGTFSGPGMSNNVFNPANAGVGTHTIRYEGNLGGCTYTTTQNVTVTAVPQAQITGLNNEYCRDAQPVPLNGTPTGGQFTVNGTTTNTFNPGAPFVNIGNNTIEYRGNFGGCAYTTTRVVVVTERPTPSILGLNNEYCTTAGAVQLVGNPAGGTFSGPGVSNNIFNPGAAGTGQITIRYEGTFRGCTYTTTQTIRITAPVTPTITLSAQGPFCVEVNSITLTGTPSGGNFSGTGVSGNQFSPSTAGVGTHTITYSGNLGGCAYSTSIQVEVSGKPNAAILGLESTYCVTAPAVTINGIPSGGTFSINPAVAGAISGNTFNPAVAGAGTFTITYSGTTRGCQYSTSQQVTVEARPTASISGIAGGVICVDASPVQLTGTPSGGTFSGPGTTPAGLFSPANVGPGSFTITYSGSQGSCTYSTSISARVSSRPSTTISGLSANYCVSQTTPVTINATPPGGTFSGPGVVNNTFIPANAGVGEHTITYRGNFEGCNYSTSVNLRVSAEPIVEIGGLQNFICRTASPVVVTATPQGGSFQGPGMIGNIFDPARANVGVNTITYSGNFFGCQYSRQIEVTVTAPPTPSITGLAGPYCIDSDQVTLTGTPGGGTFEGPGILTGTSIFSPSQAGAGTHTITYRGNFNGCLYSTQTNVTVTAKPTPTISGLNNIYCANASPVSIIGTPVGGTFSGPGITGANTFSPAAAGTGTFTIRYEGTIGGCRYATTQQVTVEQQPTANISGIISPICINANPITLTGAPAGGTLSGPGIQGNNFNPSLAGAGTHTISYVGNTTACQFSTTATIRVTAQPLATISGLQSAYCVTSTTPVTLSGTPLGGTFSGPGVSGNTFSPSAAGVGSHTIEYRGNFEGCNFSTTQTVNVGAQPTARVTGPGEGGLCINAGPTAFIGEPAGGRFSGSGISENGIFDPSATGAGTFTITYQGTLNGCNYSTTRTITVTAQPNAAILNITSPLCITASPVNLQATPSGGTFSGPGVQGSIFTPSVAGAGTHTISYGGNLGGCSYSTSVSVTITSAPTPQIVGLNNEYCTTSDPVILIGNPAGGTFSGAPGISGNRFTPSTPGNYTITYSGTIGGCSYTTNVQVRVTAPPTVSVTGLVAEYCATENNVTLNASPAGGTFSGPGISGNTFSPAAAGAGSHTITYSGNLGGCVYSTTLSVTVTAPPTPSIVGLNNAYCRTSPPVTLTGLPTGGSFSGPGISGNAFNPANVTPGVVTITYSGNFRGCAYSTTRQVTVDNNPVASIAGLQNVYCQTAQPVTIIGTPAGGTFSGPGVLGTQFNPSVAGVGTHTITYAGNAGACTYSTSITIRVSTPVVPTIEALPEAVCITTSAITLRGTPAGGTFSGTGVSVNTFSPQTAGAGTHTITYSGTQDGCSYSTTVNIRVTPTPTNVEIVGLAPAYCLNSPAATLLGNPTGGTFSGNGVVGNTFNPAVAGIGTHTITYRGSIGGCDYQTTRQVSVSPIPSASITGLAAAYCSNASEVALTGTPAGGTFTGPGIITGTNRFNPGIAGAGTHTITYAGNVGGCAFETSATVRVTQQPTPSIAGLGTQYCTNNPPVTMIGTPAGGNFSSDRGGVVGNTFSPSTGAGVYRITYSGTIGGCNYSTTVTVTVSQAQTATISGFKPTYCSQEAPVNFSATPSGGTFEGPGISPDGRFTPALAGAGTHTISYSGVAGGCSYFSSVQIRVIQQTPPAIFGLASQYCTTGSPVDLAGIPLGGTFSGPGISGNRFNPANAGAGTHTITYSGSENGCNYTTSATVSVTQFIQPSVTAAGGLQPSYCATDADIPLILNPAGGSLNGPGIIGNSFSPRIAGPGTHTIFYFGNQGGCVYNTTVTIRVANPPITFVGGLDPNYCSNSAPATLTAIPAGGRFEGPGISGNQFNPAQAGAGIHTITYKGNLDGCEYSTTTTVTVTQAPTPNITGFTNPNNAYCSTDNAVVLTGTPAGGTFTGPGMAGNVFTPSLAGPGTHTIRYEGRVGACAYSTTVNVTVTLPVIAAISGVEEAFCINSPAVTLQVTPPGGTLSGPGTSGLRFDPSIAGAGTHVLTYSGNVGGCSYSASVTVFVSNLPAASIAGLSAEYCLNSPSASMVGSPVGGTFRGPGVVGSTFNPALAGAGTHTIEYRGSKDGCAYTTSVNVTVVAPVPAAIGGLAPQYCTNSSPVTLSGVPLGGSFSGPGVVGSTFNPAIAGVGTHTITYSNLNAACPYTTAATVRVNQPPVASIVGLSNQYCSTSSAVSLIGQPAGGSFSGPGVSGNTFNPAAAGVGTITITYSGTSNGCSYSTTQQVEITQQPVASISGIGSSTCLNTPPIVLSGSPSGGRFEGAGVVGNTFDPNIAGLGTHTIRYSGNFNGCNYTTSISVTVTNQPVASFLNLQPQYCINSPVVTLSASPGGGTFSGPGVSGNTFNPGAAGLGTHTLQYQGNIAGCSFSTTATVTVSQAPVASIIGAASNLCLNSSAITLVGNPSGGTFSGPGVNATGVFTPSNAGIGTHTITYSGVQGGCSYSTTVTITVVNNPVATISGLSASYCFNAAAVTLIGSPAGGNFSGPGVVGNTFNPTLAGAGTHTIRYEGVSNNCSYSTTVSVTVVPQITATINTSQGPIASQYCSTSGTITLVGTPAGGTFSGPGVTGNTFSPSIAGIGTHTITYQGTFNGCPYSTSVTVTVTSTPTASIGTTLGALPNQVCLNTSPFTLVGTPAGGIFSGRGITGTNTFNPALAGLGTHTITYSGNISGCNFSTTANITVVTSPVASISTLGGSLLPTYCNTSNPITLVGTPAGGTFSGTGVTANTFNPAGLAPGVYTITYSGTIDGCPYTTSAQVNITAAPQPVIATINGPLQPQYCTSAGTLTLTGTPGGGTFSGTGVSGNTFNLNVAPGQYIVTYSGTFNGCAYSTSATINVVGAPQPTIATASGALANQYCLSAQPITLAGTPAGGTFSGRGVTGNTFNPAVAGIGTFAITYSGTFNGCPYSTTATVTVTNNPAATIATLNGPLANQYCNTSAPVTLVGNPAGGTFAGPAVVGNLFFPSNLTPGNYTITYTGDLNGCPYATSANVTITSTPSAAIATTTGPLPSQYCATLGPITLVGTPSGGTFSGPGISGNIFNPQLAGVGTHTITYSGIFNGCNYSTSTTITVISGPTPTIATTQGALAVEYCASSQVITLVGTPAGGTFSGRGVSGNTFNPALAGIGTHTITYRGEDQNGCPYSTTATIRVVQAPTATIATINGPIANQYCVGSSPIVLVGTPAGGIFSGNGVVGNVFDPANAGIGTFSITYRGEINGCPYSTTANIRVTSNLAATISGVSGTYCLASPIATLTAIPAGGVFSGPGVVGNTFNPALAGVGTHTISYSGVANDCPFSGTLQVTVTDNPVASISGLSEVYCSSDASSGLIGTPAGGSFSGRGISGSTFSPSVAGPGTHTITYSGSLNGCNYSTTRQVTVNATPTLSLSATPSIGNDGTITATATGGTPPYIYLMGTSSQSSVGSVTFRNLAPGNYTVEVRDANNCRTTRSVTIPAEQVNCPPPREISVIAITYRSATVTWTPVPNAISYLVEYKMQASTQWQQIIVNHPTTTVNLTNLVSSMGYDVRVSTRCAGGITSTPISTIFETRTCEAINFLFFTDVTSNSVFVNWDAVEGAVGYQVIYREYNTQNWIDTIYVAAPNTRVRLGGLRPAISYEVGVRVNCEAGIVFSPWVYQTFTTQNCDAVVSINTSAFTETSFTVSWDAVNNSAGYRIGYFRQGGTGDTTYVTVNTTSFTVSNLQPCSVYEVSVQTICLDGGLSFPIRTSVATLCNQQCLPPSSITVINRSYTEVEVRWSAVTGAQGYELQYRLLPNGNFSSIISIGASTTSYLLTNLLGGAEYEVQIRTICANNLRSPFASEVFTTPDCQGVNFLIANNVTCNSARIEWRLVEGAVGYELEFKRQNDVNWSPTLLVNGDNFSLINLDINTTYDVRLRTICVAGLSISPNIFASFTTKAVCEGECPKPVIVSVIVDQSQTGAIITWRRVPGALRYEFDYAQGEPGNAANWISRTTTDTSIAVTGLAPENNYPFRVRAICGPGLNSDYTRGIIAPIAPCPDPTNLVATVTSTTEPVQIRWNGVPEAIRYEVDTRVIGGGAWIPRGSTTVTSFSIAGLQTNRDYLVRVRSICSFGVSNYVTTFFSLSSANPRCGNPVIQLPIRIAQNNTEATISWGAVGGAQSYEVQLSNNSGQDWLITRTTSQTSITITGLVPFTEYLVRVRAICANGESSIYNYQIFTPGDCQPVTSVVATVLSNTSARVEWLPTVTAIRYEVSLSQETQGGLTPVSTTTVDAPATSQVFNNLIAGASYVAYVRAICAPGVSSIPVATNFTLTQPCTPIANINISAVENNRASISWAPVAQARGYQVEYRVAGAPTWITVVTTSATSVTITGLTGGTPYEIRVRVICTDGSTSPFTTGNFTTTTLCEVPTNVVVSSITSNAAQVSWSASSNAASYEVQYSIRGANQWITLTTVPPLATSIELRNLQANTCYDVRVRAICANGNSNFATTQFCTPGVGAGDCQDPENVGLVDVTPTRGILVWAGVPTAQSYRVEYRVLGSGSPWSAPITVLSPLVTLTGLACNTVYEVRIQAICLNGNFSGFTLFSFQTLECPSGTCPAPSNVVASALSFTTATVQWNPVPEANSYQVEYKPISTQNWTALPPTTGTSVVITNLLGGTLYDVRVRSICANATSSPTTTRFATQECDAINFLIIDSISASRAVVRWEPVVGAQGYEVEYKLQTQVQWSSPIRTTQPRVALSGLTPDRTYDVRVRVICEPAVALSSWILNSFDTKSCSPTTQVSTSEVTSFGVRVTWQPVANAEGYEVEYAPQGSNDWTRLFVSAPNTTVVINDLNSNTNYTIRVRTVCEVGVAFSGYTTTTVTTGITNCERPQSLTVSQVTDNSALVSWNPVAGASLYEIWIRKQGADNWSLLATQAATQYTIASLEPNTTYRVRVRTICRPNASVSDFVNTQFTTTDITCSTPVRVVVSNISGSRATVTWRRVPRAISYDVQYRRVGDANWQTVANVSDTTILLTTLVPNSVYEVQVRSNCGGLGNSSFSNPVAFPTAAPSGAVFQLAIGGNAWDEGFSTRQTPDGGYIVAGYTISAGAGNWDVYVVKLDAFGNRVWDRTYGGPNRDEARSIIPTNDGGYIIAGHSTSTGATETYIYLLKIDGQGNKQWERTYGGTDWRVAYDVAQTGDGGYIVVGSVNNSGIGKRDLFLMKTDAQGNVQWAQAYGGAQDDYGFSVVLTRDGGYAVAGMSNSFGQGSNDMLVIKTNSLGVVQWARTFGGPNQEDAYSIVQAPDGGFLVGGLTRSFNVGNADMYLVKTNSAGNLEWARAFGGASFDYAYGINVAQDGFVAVGGSVSFNSDVYLVKTDFSGNLLFSRTYGGNLADQARYVSVTTDNGFIITGNTRSFGQGNSDVYVIRTDVEGNVNGCNTATPATVIANLTTNTVVGTPNISQRSNMPSNIQFTSTRFAPELIITRVCQATCPSPTELLVNTSNPASVVATWRAIPNAVGYLFEYRRSGTTNWEALPIVAQNRVVLTGLTPNAQYQARVRTVCALGVDTSGFATTAFTVPGCVINTGLPDTLCYTIDAVGIPVQLRAQGGNIYRWSPGISLSDSTIANPLAYPTVVTTYTLTVTNTTTGCTFRDFVTVIPFYGSTIRVTPEAVTVCANSLVQLNASGGDKYTWTPTTGLNNPTIPSPVASPSTTTTYTVRVANLLGCAIERTVTINVSQGALVSATATGTTCPTCTDGSIAVTITGGTPPYRVRLNGGNEQITSTTSVVYANLATGVYTITVNDRDGSGCTSSASIVLGQQAATCAVPGSVSVDLISATTATIRWSAVSSAISYEVSYKPLNATTWIDIVPNPINATSVALSNLQPNTQYEARVRSNCGSGIFSEYSNPVRFTTLSGCQAPAITQIQPAINNAIVTWIPVPGATRYSISWRRDAVGTAWNTISTGLQTSFTISGLDPNTRYLVRVQAECSGILSVWSSESNFTTLPSRLQTFSTQNFDNVTVYPNPSRGNFILQLEAAQQGQAYIRIVDLTGRVALENTSPIVHGLNQIPVQIERYTPGIYILELRLGEQIFKAKIMFE
ncbi:MAG: fibronectin type III domain-containing protein [Bacteroidia bacterium]|nr:fibronectin type III domain-containing protein [Bacteroidia bacterium]